MFASGRHSSRRCGARGARRQRAEASISTPTAELVVVGDEDGVVDVVDVHLVEVFGLDDVQTGEASDARKRDVWLPHPEGSLWCVQEVVKRTSHKLEMLSQNTRLPMRFLRATTPRSKRRREADAAFSRRAAVERRAPSREDAVSR